MSDLKSPTLRRTCALLYSEEQGCFHHDPPASKGDERFKLLERGVPEVMGFVFAQYLHNINPDDTNLSFAVVKELWDKFSLMGNITIDDWWRWDEFLITSKELIADELSIKD